jgi:hypothetical protein
MSRDLKVKPLNVVRLGFSFRREREFVPNKMVHLNFIT